MIDFNQKYNRDNALNFLRDNLLPEDLQILEEDIPIQQSSGKLTEKAVLLGIAPSLDLNVYEFTHKSENDPRVTITKEAFRFLANRGEQRALAFFVSKNSPNYRFSLITIDLKPSGKKVEKIISNPKRYSYYLGPDAKINTPTKYLISKGRIIDFEDLKSRFSIEVVNKEFFKQISKYFMILAGGKWEREDFGLGELILPSTVEHQKKQEFTVRLIGRIIFCWFLKKKNSIQGKPLIPKELLSANLIEKNYYHNVLEPLFFEVLNRQKEQRDKKFRTELFDTIPFLNGGLFEPHDDDFYAVDSELKFSKYFNNLTIPDDWFEGLFGVLETYNFTIDENTSSDIDLSVDPEMLGRIFENLLAEINPETGETARKSTGSYYTPRAIVDYMVNQSIKYYLLEKTKIDEDRIDKLVNNTFDNVELSKDEQREIIDAFSSLKVIDPACGSGAFPMGILQKVVSILSEVDPESQLWLDKQLEKIEDSILKRTLEQSLSGGTVNYVHKLGLIQNSIYGVDIQEIAVELSKLRVFLSLVVDAKVDDSKDNRGLEPLPNLEFKFVCANSLIDLPAEKFYLVDNKTGNIGTLHNELKKLREDYFSSHSDNKERIKKEFKEKQKQLFNVFLEWGSYNEDQKSLMLSEWDPFSNKPSSWFNPEWMFGVSDGFDIVIANPSYGVNLSEYVETILQSFNYLDSRKNSASFFLELSSKIMKENGITTYIVPKSLTFVDGWNKPREFILKKNVLLSVMDISKSFENVLLEQVIVIYQKNIPKENKKIQVGCGWNKTINILNNIDYALTKNLDIIPCYVDEVKLSILNKIQANSILLSKISTTSRGLPWQRKLSDTGIPILKGKNIGRYCIKDEISNLNSSFF